MSFTMKISLFLLICCVHHVAVDAFQISSQAGTNSIRLQHPRAQTTSYYQQHQLPLHMVNADEEEIPLKQPEIVIDEDAAGGAATNTINERLLTELQEAANKEKFGARSSMTKQMGMGGFNMDKTDAERQAAIDAARNLNGVNPLVALAGGLFGLAMAGVLWFVTLQLAEWFAMNPVQTDVYFVQRTTAVIRNIVMGLSSLASGFFGVTGVGIFALGVKVAIGVAKGELDPTPIVKKKGDEIDLPNMWDLMLNKKPTRRNGGGDNNPFGN